MTTSYDNFIGGAWTPPMSGQYRPDLNPADFEDVVGQFPESDEEDARSAIEAAGAAFAAWRDLPAPSRGSYLRNAADILEAGADQLARDIMREEGKSVAEARGETLRAVTILRYYAMHTMLPDGEVIPSASVGTLLYTRRVPLGVCALITPWNFPIAIPVWKAAPALAFGNTVVLKPSELAPLTAWNLARCFEEAGLPPGVFNVVFGRTGPGPALTTHPGIAAISFTGSVATGKLIASAAAAHGKKYQLEMGGKNAAVVLDDADTDQALALTLQGAYKSAGEKCTATSRVIVEQGIYAEFAGRLSERVRSLTVGPGDDSAAYLGPLISPIALKRVTAAVEEAVREGAELLAGGAIPGAPYDRGFYVRPFLLGRVKPDMRIAREEVFGPVLCLMQADDLDHAIDLTNDVDYGLSASIFTRNLNAAMTFADRVQAGMIRINGETAGVEPQAPFGGMKASSSWSREQGLAARDFYTQIKTISVDRAG